MELETAYAARDLRLRRFGVAYEDLLVDFGQTVGPQLITELLACCTQNPAGQTPAEQFFWALGVGKRIECLLILANLEGAGVLSIPLRCPHPSCGQPIELDLTLAELLAVGQEAGEDPVCVPLGAAHLVLRRPTGADQLAWLQDTFHDERMAVQAIIRTLMVEGPEVALSPACIEQIETLLDRHDPLVQFGLSVVCPYCQELAPHDVDLAAFAVQQLRAAQARLIEVVHRLAAQYHWTEAEILAIPPWRRACYLALVEREEAR
jgi:hypothetical protein